MKEKIKEITEEEKDKLKNVQKFIEESGISEYPTKLEEKPPNEFFQRFVEACFWCTTYDFTPTYKEMDVVNSETPFTYDDLVLLPFPESFWDNLISRHYDPFWQRGDKTYKEI